MSFSSLSKNFIDIKELLNKLKIALKRTNKLNQKIDLGNKKLPINFGNNEESFLYWLESDLSIFNTWQNLLYRFHDFNKHKLDNESSLSVRTITDFDGDILEPTEENVNEEEVLNYNIRNNEMKKIKTLLEFLLFKCVLTPEDEQTRKYQKQRSQLDNERRIKYQKQRRQQMKKLQQRRQQMMKKLQQSGQQHANTVNGAISEHCPHFPYILVPLDKLTEKSIKTLNVKFDCPGGKCDFGSDWYAIAAKVENPTEAIAFVCGNLTDSSTLYIKSMCTHPDHQRQGLGTLLIAGILLLAKSRNIDNVLVETNIKSGSLLTSKWKFSRQNTYSTYQMTHLENLSQMDKTYIINTAVQTIKRHCPKKSAQTPPPPLGRVLFL